MKKIEGLEASEVDSAVLFHIFGQLEHFLVLVSVLCVWCGREERVTISCDFVGT